MKRTITGYVTYESFGSGVAPRIDFFSFEPDPKVWPDLVVVRKHSIEIEVPDDFDPRPQLIKSLQEQQTKARADFENLCTDIQRKISELTCLEAA